MDSLRRDSEFNVAVRELGRDLKVWLFVETWSKVGPQ